MDLTRTQDRLVEAFVQRSHRDKGLRTSLNAWRQIMHSASLPTDPITPLHLNLATLFDLSVLHPLLALLETEPDHPAACVRDLSDQVSLAINELAATSRRRDGNSRALFRLLALCTTQSEGSVVLASSPSSGSRSGSSGGSKSSRGSSGSIGIGIGSGGGGGGGGGEGLTTRSQSFSGSVEVPHVIEEMRCKFFRDGEGGHECEGEGCENGLGVKIGEPRKDSVAVGGEERDDAGKRGDDGEMFGEDGVKGPDELEDAFVDLSDGVESDDLAEVGLLDESAAADRLGEEEDESDADSLMMGASPDGCSAVADSGDETLADIRHERMRSLQKLTSESPLELKRRRLQRVYSLPVGSVLGSVPARKRRVTADGSMVVEREARTPTRRGTE
ncbi:hypothetical protein CAC42_4115 [Sphaceloma murrayae]|uniref:Uncharacterized protein n=1 Tax=Sphaceloma murrayae TaxID=2082308 RepID=A0A2K1QLG7_9PEZI|nr:hypothetical protein CAC42_4115 [Sphaceloma murrayae]